MDIILYLIAGLALGSVIGYLIGKSTAWNAYEQKIALAHQRSTELEKELAALRATQAAQLGNMQQQLQAKAGEFTALQVNAGEQQQQLAQSGASLEDHETVHGGGESLPDEVGADEARASGDDPGAHAHTAEAGSRFRAAAERAGTLFRKVIFGPKLSRPQDRVTIPAARHSKNRP